MLQIIKKIMTPLIYFSTLQQIWNLQKFAAGFLVKATTKQRKLWVDEFNKKIKTPCQRVLSRPFLRSHDFSAWYSNCNALLWLQSLFNLTRFFATDEKISNSEKDELKTLVIEIDEVLNKHLKIEENLLENTKALLEFSYKIKQHLEQQS